MKLVTAGPPFSSVLLFLACLVPAAPQPVQQLPGLNVRALAIDPDKPSTIYAGTSERALLRSTDDGATWTPVAGLPARAVRAVAIRSGVLVVFTDVGTVWSSDSGATWIDGKPPSLPVSYHFTEEMSDLATRYSPQVLTGGAVVNGYAVDPFDNQIVYAATDRGVFKTNTGVLRTAAREWQSVSTGLPGSRVYALAFDYTRAGVIAALTSRGLFVTSDSAAHWGQVSSTRPPAEVWSLAIQPMRPGVVFAGTDHGVFKSADGGEHWEVLPHVPAVPAVLALSIDPLQPERIYAGTLGSGVFKSVDGGSTWRVAGSGIAGQIVGALVLDPLDTGIVYAGTGLEFGHTQGVLKSTDGGESWVPAGKGLSTTFGIWAMAIADTRPKVLYAATGDLFRSVDGGARWTNFSHTEKRILTYTSYRDRLKSDVHSLAIDPGNPAVQYAGGRDEIYKSADGGATWIPAKLGTDNFDVFSLAIDPTRSGTLYAVTSAVVIRPPGGTVFKSIDGGTTWAASGQGLPPARFLSIAVDGADARVIYAGSLGAGLFKSSDQGKSWSAHPALKGLTVYALAVSRTGEVYAGTGSGIFKSRDRGATWVAVNTGLAAGSVAPDSRKQP